jgi:DNA (cytosine-5)-methyltransferase 1
MGVDGRGVADEAPGKDFIGMPKLTPRMIARIQGFPDDWNFGDKKTKACRMIGNAFPPPVARAVGERIIKVLSENKNNTLRYGRTDYQGKKTVSREVAYA